MVKYDKALGKFVSKADTFRVGDTAYDADSSSPGKVVEVSPIGTVKVVFDQDTAIRYKKEEVARGALLKRPPF